MYIVSAACLVIKASMCVPGNVASQPDAQQSRELRMLIVMQLLRVLCCVLGLYALPGEKNHSRGSFRDSGRLG